MADLLRWLARFARLLAWVARQVVQAFRRSRSERSPTEGAERTEALPTPERYAFVLERVKAYRDEFLSYEIGLERHRRSASREALTKALALDNELPEVRSMPVLYLNSDEWIWDQQQLRRAVRDSVEELELVFPDNVNEPTAQAARACEQWAAVEARCRFDRAMAPDSRATPP